MQWVACSLSRARLTNCCGTLVAWPWTSRTHLLGSDFEDVSKSFLSWTAHLPAVTRKSSVLFTHCRFLFWEVASCYFWLPIVCGIPLFVSKLLSKSRFPNEQVWMTTFRSESFPKSHFFASVFQNFMSHDYSWDRLSSLPHIESMCLWGHLPS